LGEHLLCTQKVASSTLVTSTIYINSPRLIMKDKDCTELTMEQLEAVCGGQCYRGKQEYRAKIMNWHKIKEKKIKKFNF
jgi:hypothetical protein